MIRFLSLVFLLISLLFANEAPLCKWEELSEEDRKIYLPGDDESSPNGCMLAEEDRVECLLESDSESKSVIFFKEQMTNYLKKYGLGYCLGYKSNVGENMIARRCDTQKIESFYNPAFLNHVIDKFQEIYSDKPINVLLNYIDTYGLDYKRYGVLSACLDMYDSKEYDEKVKNIVEKYCKDCK